MDSHQAIEKYTPSLPLDPRRLDDRPLSFTLKVAVVWCHFTTPKAPRNPFVLRLSCNVA
jgi:hypothetical protein